jgi:TusA-related sulfurtransferase
MTATVPRTIELDIRGQICPSTLLVALREMNNNIDELNAGCARLFIRTDNRDAINTIPEAAGNMGFQVDVCKTGAAYTILIFK